VTNLQNLDYEHAVFPYTQAKNCCDHFVFFCVSSSLLPRVLAADSSRYNMLNAAESKDDGVEECKRQNFIVCWDFDWSLINENSDHYVQQKLYGETKYKTGLLPTLQEKASKEGVHVFTDYQDKYGWPTVFNNFRLNATSFGELLSDIPVFPENVHIVKTINQHCENNTDGQSKFKINQYIVSNANDVLIDVILKKHELNGSVFKSDQIFTNPGWYDSRTGMLRCERYHNVELMDGDTQSKKVAHAHDCDLCHANLCKGKVLREEVMPRHGRLHSYDNVVVYVGDGENDFCPVSMLKQGDYAFVRQFDQVSGLEAKVKENGDRLKCNIMTWRNGEELLQNFKKVLPDLEF